MYEYSRCRGVPRIGELMDEHTALVDQAHDVRAGLAAGNRPTPMARLNGLVARLHGHVHREEDGIFLAMRTASESTYKLDQRAGDHHSFVAANVALEPAQQTSLPR